MTARKIEHEKDRVFRSAARDGADRAALCAGACRDQNRGDEKIQGHARLRLPARLRAARNHAARTLRPYAMGARFHVSLVRLSRLLPRALERRRLWSLLYQDADRP